MQSGGFWIRTFRRRKDARMERHIIPDSENRMILLETLSSIGPLSDTQLLVFVTDLSLMNYFSLHLNLSELEQQGLIEQYRHPFAMLYRITDSGRYMLESFPNIIPQSRRKLLSANVTAYRDRFRSQQLMPCSESRLPDGTTCIRLQLLEKDLLVLDMRLKTSEHLSCLEKRWQTIASEIYSLISDTLTEGFHRNRTGPVPETVSLTKSVRGEWTLYMADPPEDPTFSIIISLADEELCRHWARRWSDSCAVLREAIEALLRNSLNN